MEENRRFSFSSLLIKIIIVIIFVLFTVWLLSLSNKDLSNSLDVLTENIFSQNIEKMKEVGKDYFTTERLPKKVGEIETLTLEEMYKKKLILELTDQDGNACSAKDSYVSIEKFNDEYQMKVYLECGEQSDYIIVIMGCYDYCDTDICEKVDKEETKQIEYQYIKTTNGSWTDYGAWSDWSNVLVTNTDYRQVEVKKENEEYSYDKTITDVVYKEFNASCPEGYTPSGNICIKTTISTDTKNPACPTVSGYTLVGRDGFTCSYIKQTEKTNTLETSGAAVCPTGYTKSGSTCVKSSSEVKSPTCPTVSGYTLTGRDGFTCSYSKATSDTKNPTCPTVSGYTLTGRDGFTCSYSKENTQTVKPTCPTVSGYTMIKRDGFTCNYRKYVKGDYVGIDTGEVVPGNTTSNIYEEIGTAEYIYDCKNSCAFRWIHTWEVYEVEVLTTTKTATCPTGYDKSGSMCVKGVTETTTKTASCPTGYTKSGNSCVKDITETTTKTASCSTGYTKSGNTCVKITTSSVNPTCSTKSGWTLDNRNGFTCNYSKVSTETITETTTKTASCPTGYTKSDNKCTKTVENTLSKDYVYSCPTGYTRTDDGTKCYKEVKSTETVTDTREVTYYRYRIREYKGGSTDYKWSKSKDDKSLLNAGYKLTGSTR